MESGNKKIKHPAYFIPELAHVCALYDERIPFTVLANEVRIRKYYRCLLNQINLFNSFPTRCCDVVDETRNFTSRYSNRSECDCVVIETSSVTASVRYLFSVSWVDCTNEKTSFCFNTLYFERERSLLGSGVRHVRYSGCRG